ncbi:hypothetical protein MMC25_004466 [Agyrium rufum]|nr:hypothetical protein [Agyrium rufum]
MTAAPETAPNPLPPNEDRGSQVIAIRVVFYGIAGVCLCLRVFTNWKFARRWTWADYSVITAMVLALVEMALQIVAIHYGLGRHV